ERSGHPAGSPHPCPGHVQGLRERPGDHGARVQPDPAGADRLRDRLRGRLRLGLPDRGDAASAPHPASRLRRQDHRPASQGADRDPSRRPRAGPTAQGEPRTGLSMGEHMALTAAEWGITREAQDELAMTSHHKLAAAYDAGFFDDLVTGYRGLSRDQNLRPDSTLEKLASLKPVFGVKSPQ